MDNVSETDYWQQDRDADETCVREHAYPCEDCR